MRILILNSGSSSLKFWLVEYPSSSSEPDTGPTAMLQGIVTGIGLEATLMFGTPNTPHPPLPCKASSTMAEKEQLSLDDMYDQLNTQSGLLGLSGQSSDIKALLQTAHEFPSPRLPHDRCFPRRQEIS